MEVRHARDQDFQRIMELYRQLQPEDPILSDGRDRLVFEQILRADNLNLLVLLDLGRIHAYVAWRA